MDRLTAIDLECVNSHSWLPIEMDGQSEMMRVREIVGELDHQNRSGEYAA